MARLAEGDGMSVWPLAVGAILAAMYAIKEWA